MNKNKRPLMEPFTCSGLWAIPGESDPVSGVLRYAPEESITLEIMSLNVKNYNPVGAGIKVGLIYGVTSDNRYFYLRGNLKGSSNMNGGWGPSFYNQTFFVNYLIESSGILPWTDEMDIAIDRLEIGFDNLSSWMGARPIAGEIIDDRTYAQKLNIAKRKSHIIGSEKTRVSFVTSSGTNVDQSNPSLMSGSVTARNMIRLEPKVKRDIDWYLAYLRKLQHMLIVLMGSATNVNHVAGRVVTRVNGRKRNNKLLVYWTQRINVPRDKEFSKESMLVPYESFKQPKRKIEAWLSSYNKTEDQIGLFAETILFPGMDSAFCWLALTQAIEAYHRKSFGGRYMSKKKYMKNVVPVLNAAIPRPDVGSDHRISLKGRIKFGYEYSMNRRLKEILQKLPNELVELFLKRVGGIEIKHFTNTVTQTRNYYTHYDEAIDRVDPSKEEDYIRVLQQIMLAHLMKNMAFTDKELVNAFVDKKASKKKASKKKASKKKASKKKASKKKGRRNRSGN